MGAGHGIAAGVIDALPEESREVRDWLSQRSDAVLPIWNTDVRMFGQPVQVFGVADHATYRDHWPMLQATPDAWNRIADGKGMLANEQLARINGFRDVEELLDRARRPVFVLLPESEYRRLQSSWQLPERNP